MGSSSAATNLEDVPSVDLMSELLRRFKCSSKPDKRLILIGIYVHTYIYIISLSLCLQLQLLLLLLLFWVEVFIFMVAATSDPEILFRVLESSMLLCPRRIYIYIYIYICLGLWNVVVAVVRVPYVIPRVTRSSVLHFLRKKKKWKFVGGCCVRGKTMGDLSSISSVLWHDELGSSVTGGENEMGSPLLVYDYESFVMFFQCVCVCVFFFFLISLWWMNMILGACSCCI